MRPALSWTVTDPETGTAVAEAFGVSDYYSVQEKLLRMPGREPRTCRTRLQAIFFAEYHYRETITNAVALVARAERKEL